MARKFIDLSKFTDVINFDQDGSDSQPISLSTNSPSPQPVENIDEQLKIHAGQYKEFRSVQEIEPQYQNVFSYSYFNLVQSKVIDDALYSDKSMAICSPTGTGKTVVFEMAIVKLLMDLKKIDYKNDFKIIYMAPVKAICSERIKEWHAKFSALGLLCIEVTGDKDVDFSQLKPFSIIITTPEKWDILTRRWRDYKGLVEAIKLFLIDEVHILNDQTRGPVLEAVVSRMKTIQMSAQFAHRFEQAKLQMTNVTQELSIASPQIRFVAVSATVSNPEDVAAWLETPEKLAVYHKFGDECRPVKIKRVVEGYPCSEGASIFKFDILLNYKLWPIIQKYYNGKPTLIFCNTRKSVMMAAEILSRELTINFSLEQKSKLTALANTIKNKKIKTLILNGIGCHHAGLLFEERVNIENSFRQKDLPILITTTTLAMGVNLPAHLVIIKNTQYYVNGQFQEYSISTILQMVGRAGRPQFDTEATAVIMTRAQDKRRYQSLIEGTEPLESFLHHRLAENLNSEVALRTISDLVQSVQWVKSTFLYVRAARNPRKYLGLPHNAPQQQITYKIEELCNIAMNRLVSAGFVTMDEACCVQSTNMGHLMSVYYLDFETMKHFMKIEGSESLEKLLWVVCESHELADMHLRVDERRCLNALNRSNTAATIRFPMKGKINSRQMKLNCIIQAVLGCLHIPDPSLNQEAMKIMRVAERVCKGMVAYVTGNELLALTPCFFTTVVNAILLAKCITAHLWENSPYMTRQLKGIGPAFSALLAAAGKNNFNLIEESHPRDLERIMNKGPPAGNLLRKQVSLFPKYRLTVAPIDTKTVSIQLQLLNYALLSENMDSLTAGENHKFYIVVGDAENNLLFLTSFKDKELINVYDGLISKTVTRKHDSEHNITAYCISASYVGLDVQTEFTFKSLQNKTNALKNVKNDSKLERSIELQKPARKQMAITDTYKPRKRKLNIEGCTFSHEKRKKQTISKDELKYQSDLDKTNSKDSMDNIQATLIVSSDSKATSPCYNNDFNAGNCKAVGEIANFDLYKNTELLAEYEDLISEDFNSSTEPTTAELDRCPLQENYINKIINDIENEICKTKTLKNCNEKYKSLFSPKKVSNITNSTTNNKISNEYEVDTIGSDTFNYIKFDNNNFRISKTCKSSNNINNNNNKRYVTNRGFSKFNNYNVIDKIERKNNITHQSSTDETQREDGFCTAAKLYLDQYLNTIKITKETSCDNVLRLLQNEKNYERDNCYENKESNKEVVIQNNNIDKEANDQQIKSEIRGTPGASKSVILNEGVENLNVHEKCLNLISGMGQKRQLCPNYNNKMNRESKEENNTSIVNEQYEDHCCDDLLVTDMRDSESKLEPYNDTFSTLVTLPISNSTKYSAKLDLESKEIDVSTKNNDHVRALVCNEKENIDDYNVSRELNNESSLTKLLPEQNSTTVCHPLLIKNTTLLKNSEAANVQNENTLDNEIITAISMDDDDNDGVFTNLDGEIKRKMFCENNKITTFEKNDKKCSFLGKQGNTSRSMNFFDDYSCTFTNVHRFSSNEIDVIQKLELDIRFKKSTTYVMKAPKIIKIPDKQITRRILYSDKNPLNEYCDPVSTYKKKSFKDVSGTNSECVMMEVPRENLINGNLRSDPQFIPDSKMIGIDGENLSEISLDNKSKMKRPQTDLSETYNTNVKNTSNISVQDILEKYRNLTKIFDSGGTPLNIERDTKKTNLKKNQTKSATKRPFNISDIYKATETSSDKFIHEKPLRSCEPYVLYNSLDCVEEHDDKYMPKIKQIDIEESNKDDIVESVDNIACLQELDNRSPDKTMHQIMLNPMKLLQYHKTNNDDEIILPPPPEFSDNFETLNPNNNYESDDDENIYYDNVFSPSNKRDIFNDTNVNSYNQEQFDNGNPCDVSSRSENMFLELKPSQKVETWTLSKDEPLQFHPSQTLLTLHEISSTPAQRINSLADIEIKKVFSRNDTSNSSYNVNNSTKSTLKEYSFTKEKMKKRT